MFRPKLAFVLCALLTLLTGALAAQDPPATKAQRRAAQIERLKRLQEEAERKELAANVETLRQLQGTWQLMTFTAEDLPDEGRQTTGFMTVAGEFLSLEMHMGYFAVDGEEESSFIQTGTYRLTFNDHAQLQATLLIGSIDDGTGMTTVQVPGEVSTHDVEVNDDVLQFTAEDGARMTLERVGTSILTDMLYEEVEWLPGALGREALAEAREAAAREESDE